MFWFRQIWDFSLHTWGGFCPPHAVWPVWHAGVCMRCLVTSIINMHIICRGGIRKWNIWLLGTPCSLYSGYLLLTERIWSWRGWRVEVFKYLGRLLAYDDKDTKAMRVNLKKAWQCWAWISFVLRAENAFPWVSGVFQGNGAGCATLCYWDLKPSPSGFKTPRGLPYLGRLVYDRNKAL